LQNLLDTDRPGIRLGLEKKQHKNIHNCFPEGLLCRRGIKNLHFISKFAISHQYLAFICETIQDRTVVIM